MVEEATKKMATTKAQQKAVNKYIKGNYDRINLTIPKGQKAAVQAAAAREGESLNSYTNKALLARMGLAAWPGAKEE